jgi:hypothetical protein
MVFTVKSLLYAELLLACLMAPGAWLAYRRTFAPWAVVAAGFASFVIILLAVAIVSSLVGAQIGLWITAPILVGLLVLSWLARGPRRSSSIDRYDLTWMIVTAAIITAVSGFIVYQGVVNDPRGLIFKGWFRADFFKHLAHVNALYNLGIPALDIFNSGHRLHYYWLFYIFPASLGYFTHDVQSALASSIVVQTSFFWMLIYGIFRSLKITPPISSALSLFLWLSPTMEGLAALSLSHFDLIAAATDIEVGAMFSGLIGGSTFFRLNTVIPQHQLMLAVLLSWYHIYFVASGQSDRVTKVLAHIPLTAAGAISTLFGAVCLMIFGLATLLDGRLNIVRRISLISVVGIFAIAVVVLVHVVNISFGHQSLESPLFESYDDRRGYFLRLLLGFMGLFPLASPMIVLAPIGLIYFWKNKDSLPYGTGQFFSAMFIVAIVVMIGTQTGMENRRVAHEIQLRSSLLLSLSTLVEFVVVCRYRSCIFHLKQIPAFVLVLTFLTGVMTPVIDTMWHVRREGGWPSLVPSQDLRILSIIKTTTPPDARVLQYPEPPLLKGGGRDQWVPIIAGRIVPASLRATDWRRAEPVLEDIHDFFRGRSDTILDQVDYVYLSRALHETTYDRIFNEMKMNHDWKAVMILRDASLFERNSGPSSPGML